jgi:predicted metal-dependent HD superfamily phosphohydrolase
MFTAMAERLITLQSRYNEPHRAYHTMAHIQTMLARLLAMGDAIHNAPRMELAIWYHDAIYDPAAKDNEGRSAALMQTELTHLADPVLLRGAGLMIGMTATHHLLPGLAPDLAADSALFLDMDMEVLGAEPPQYDAYEAGIAQEYTPVFGPDAFRRGRAQFLEELLARPRLFITDYFHHLLDKAARDNIRRVLSR